MTDERSAKAEPSKPRTAQRTPRWVLVTGVVFVVVAIVVVVMLLIGGDHGPGRHM